MLFDINKLKWTRTPKSYTISKEKIEKIILDEFEYESLVKIDGNTVNVIVLSSVHDYMIANNIMRRINEEFNTEMYITVKFN